MAESLPSSLVCSVCLDVCKRGAQMKCCGARACRACAVLKIYKTKRCWNEECAKENVSIATHLKNDNLLRQAVENFNKQGKMATTHKKILKNTRDGKGLEKKQIWKDLKTKKTPVDVSKKFKQFCGFGEQCKRKGCLFVHDKPTLGDRKKATTAVLKGIGNSCKKEYFDENCKIEYPAANPEGCAKKHTYKFTHLKINKPEHNPSNQAEGRANVGRKSIRNQFIPVLLNGNQIKSGLGASMDGVEGLVGGELGGLGGHVGGELGASTEELKGGGQGESMEGVGGHVGGELEESMGGLVGGGIEEMAGGLEPMEMRVMATNDDSEGDNTNLKQELQRMLANAALYGILPSYDGILGVINGINTAMSSN